VLQESQKGLLLSYTIEAKATRKDLVDIMASRINKKRSVISCWESLGNTLGGFLYLINNQVILFIRVRPFMHLKMCMLILIVLIGLLIMVSPMLW
jgi:hypothetical protein